MKGSPVPMKLGIKMSHLVEQFFILTLPVGFAKEQVVDRIDMV